MRRRSTLYLLLLIAVLTAVGSWVAFPGSREVFGRRAEAVRGLDLQGGLQVLLQARPGSLQAAQAAGTKPDDAMEAAKAIVEQRVNGLGVTEPLVQRQGSDRIVVELPGIKNPKQAISTFGSTGLLEFVDAGDTPLQAGTLVNTSLGTARGGAQPGATTTAAPQGSPPVIGPAGSQPPAGTGTPAAAQITPEATPSAAATPAAGAQTTPAAVPTDDPGFAITPPEQLQQTFSTIMTGSDIAKASAGFDQTTSAPLVQFTLTGEGARKFGTHTQNNVGKYLAIVLDKKVISSPTIQSPITGGEGQITGVDREEANSLALQLKYGSLPVALDVKSSNTVGATLGNDSVERSILAGLIGVLAVALFMILYYRLPGLISVVALVIYSILVFALFKLIPVTLTLAGIAGFVLSIGMAVDANVLIFARMKEELRRGRGLLQAVDAGFKNAWPSIRDSNISTLITCAVLYWFGLTFGASIIKGFAVTLAIGVLVSMFTAITVSRTLLSLVVRIPAVRNVWLWGIGGNEAASLAPTRPAAGPALGGTRPR